MFKIRQKKNKKEEYYKQKLKELTTYKDIAELNSSFFQTKKYNKLTDYYLNNQSLIH